MAKLLPALVLLLLLSLAATSPAQILPPPPMKKMYGVGDREFLISAWANIRADTNARGISGPIDLLWPWCDSMGVSTIRYYANWGGEEKIDTLMASRRRDTSGTPRHRIIASHLSTTTMAGYGMEALFYPNSARWRFPRYPIRFTRTLGGRDTVNPAEPGADGRPSPERVYVIGNTSPNFCVARDIVFNHRPSEVHRYSFSGYTPRGRPIFRNPWDSVQNSYQFMHDWLYEDHLQEPAVHDTIAWVAVKGHLFPGGRARPNDTVLRVEVWHEIPHGTRWADPRGVVRTAGDNLEFRVATFGVLKRDLMPAVGTGADWNRYREPAFSFLPRWNRNGMRGPLHPESASRRIDIRVYWTGAEPVALHSVALRDSVGQALIGGGPNGVALRATIGREIRRIVYTPVPAVPRSGRTPRPTFRRDVIGIASGVEQKPFMAAGFAAVHRMLHDSFRLDATNRLPAWTEGADDWALHEAADLAVVTPEIGMDYHISDGVELWAEAPSFITPTIREHNGGRFPGLIVNAERDRGRAARYELHPIPLLELTADSIDQVYETSIQRCRWGQYAPFTLPWPFERMATHLGRAAEVSRDRRRRMHAVIFNNARIYFNYRKNPVTGYFRLDTTMSHIPEPAELRMMVNLALCYGARGVHYQNLDAQTNIVPLPGPDSASYQGGLDVWGSNGPFTGDVWQDGLDSMIFYQRGTDDWYHGRTPTLVIKPFYAGWGTRTRETRRINGWLKRIGPVLTGLDWRDAYSIHFTVTQPYDRGNPRWRDLSRPLPAEEIVTTVMSLGRRWEGAGATRRATWIADSAHRTWVELGLFHPKNATANGALDTHHLFVLNRRGFERSDDISATSERGRLMDSLAEIREIRLTLNLPERPGAPLVRVREIEADTSRLPLASRPRAPLDTLLPRDGVLSITLGPGRGALLRITYEDRDRGSLEFVPGREVAGREF